jgi:endonuclease I
MLKYDTLFAILPARANKIFRVLNISASILFFLSSSPVFSQCPPDYYSTASGLSGSALKAALHNIIKNHTELSYDDVVDALMVTDEDTLNTNNVICFYTGWSYPKSEYGSLGDQWNREHVWSKSHGDFGDTPPEGSDLHHLRACDASVNSAKGNRDFSEGTTPFTDGSGPTGCFTAPYTWEPRVSDKGDVARMMFYMAVRYEGENGETDLELVSYVNTAPDGQPLYGNLDTLMKWHNDDPVNDWERDRNDAVYWQYQGNRNPFIDHPEYANLIWGEEPVSHVSEFSAHDITLTWNDPPGGVLPDGYLIRKSLTGFNDITSPTDGIQVDNDASNKNIPYGSEHCVFRNNTPGSTCYFKIFPYKGTGEMINYKTDGEILEISILVE